MFTKRLSGCVSLVLLILGSQTTGVLMVTDACFDTTRICFEPGIPANIGLKETVAGLILSGAACKDNFHLVQCTLQAMVNCTDEFKTFSHDDVAVDIEDIMAELVCDMVGDGACKTNYMQCEHDVPPETGFYFPPGGYTFHIQVDLTNQFCSEFCLAEMSAFCPYMSIAYARMQTEKLLLKDSNTDQLIVDFVNHTCPLIPEADLQCAINQVSEPQFTECVDLALQDHQQIVLFLNMVYEPTMEELRVNCQVLEDMKHCIDISVGGGCNEVTAQVLKDGLFIFGFRSNTSSCEPESGPIGNGAIYLGADTRTLISLASAVWVLAMSIHAMM